MVFWVNIPIGLIAVVMVGVFLRETTTPRRRSIDWIGALLTLLTAGSLILALVQGSQLSPVIFASVLATGAISGLLLVLHESITPEPMLPFDLWRRSRVIVVGSLGSCAAGAMMMGISAYLPAYVQGAMGYSALTGGIVLGAMSVSWSFASLFGARIMVRTTYRLVAILGGLALVTGCAILILSPVEAGPILTALGSFIVGIGMGFCMSVFVVSIQASVPWHQRGAATSSTMFLRFMGQVIGVSGCGAVMNATIVHMDPAAGTSDRPHPGSRQPRDFADGRSRPPDRDRFERPAQRVAARGLILAAGTPVRLSDAGPTQSHAKLSTTVTPNRLIHTARSRRHRPAPSIYRTRHRAAGTSFRNPGPELSSPA